MIIFFWKSSADPQKPNGSADPRLGTPVINERDFEMPKVHNV
jgi:hypothetical protein